MPSAISDSLNASSSLAAWATTTRGASRVFARHGLDFCCGGSISLGEACAAHELDVDALIAEIGLEQPGEERFERFDRTPLPEVIDHVLSRYHERHREELPRLIEMATKVEAVHAEKSGCPRGLADLLTDLRAGLETHMQKEEQILFPMLRAGHGAFAHAPIQVMEMEHDEHAERLRRIRDVAHDFEAPPAACGTWRALYLGLAELELEIMRHVHLENHVLFPRALND